ncbi:VanW family protein [Hathewaya histolytica]|uniref:Vancomycin b-type resistance protein vanW n=1 Tax=Hathewaya histolytica TaxID=1498 RepID=A0A4U9R1F3_HATHI|nr:VanW family protein [Hathewaya histolytica]VTQ85042.1 vancomycin b-type resistance protein vanW [Hathewaya histolytica]
MKKLKVKNLIMTIVLLIIMVGGAFGAYVYSTVNKWSNLVYPGVKVGDVQLGGKTKEDAQKLLKEKYQDAVLKKKIVITANNKEYSIDYKKLDAKYNISETVEEVMKHKKEESTFNKFLAIKKKSPKNVEMKFSYKQDYINSVISQVKKDVNREPKDATLTMISGSNFSVSEEKVGFKLQEDKLKKEILDKVNGKLDNEVIKIKASIETIKPKKTKDKLSTINSLISSYTTGFSSGKEGRINNIKLSTEAINGTVLMPGEKFSFNGVVGERTESRGYKKANVIINNEFVEDLGGGICQVSSTLYNTMIRSKIDPTERYSHTIASSYVDIGQDATVSWGGPDYSFVNTLDYPIYIKGYVTGNSVSFNVYSNADLKKYTYKVYSADKQTIPAKTSVVSDSSLPAGTEKVKKQSYPGHKATIYRETYEGEKLIKKEVLHRVSIAPVNGVVLKGTKQ